MSVNFAAYLTKLIKPANLYDVLLNVFGQSGAKPAPPATEAVVDYSLLDQLRRQLGAGAGDALASELLSLFLEDSPAQVAAVRAALGRQHTVELARAAHTLKGSSACIGASQLSVLCAAIESASHERDFIEAAAQFAKLEIEMTAVRASLESCLLSLQA